MQLFNFSGLALIVALSTFSCMRTSAKNEIEAETKDVSGVLTDAATLGVENSCKEFRNSPFDPRLCTDLKEGRIRPGLNSDVCKFYCNPQNYCVSPFSDKDALLEAITTIEGYALGPANLIWNTISVAEPIRKMLMAFIPWVQKSLEAWKPMVIAAQTGATSANRTTTVLCMANVIRTTSIIIQQLHVYQKTRTGDIKEDEYGAVKRPEMVAKASCGVAAMISSCGPQLSIPPNVTVLATGATFGCLAASFAANAIQCQQARDCCLGNLYASTPIAAPKLNAKNQVTKKCCRCKKQIWENRTWPITNVKIAEVNWGSSVTDTTSDVPECELREGKKFHSAVPDAQDRWTFDTYSDCKKVEVTGESCWISE